MKSMGSKNIKFESESNNKEIKKVNEECNVGFNNDDSFLADNHILSIVSGANGMIDWLVINFFSREDNVVLKINSNKT